MASTKFSEDVHPLTELKTRASALLTRRGRGVAVLIDLEEYERLVDRAAFIDAVEKGAQAAADGDLHPQSEADRILESFGKADA
jgi:PHD/YefM family antitoxin component YafN of YafNO toxin-antitoxin module